MDACFGLCRKRSKGKGTRESRHITFFADQDDVDNFVDTYPGSGKIDTHLNEVHTIMYLELCIKYILIIISNMMLFSHT
jgi:hypothetical protein